MAEGEMSDEDKKPAAEGLFAVSIRMGSQLLAAYENIVADDLDRIGNAVRDAIIENKLIQCAPEDGSRTLFLVGAGMEVKVWPQVEFTKWLAENERKQQQAMLEQQRLMMGGAPQMVSPIMVPGGGRRR